VVGLNKTFPVTTFAAKTAKTVKPNSTTGQTLKHIPTTF
jgi:hypothetical protein